jgi:glycosyltransferase involved in cell wall biosynthesis
MPSVVHVVVTGQFAGVERYVCDVATETVSRGWDVVVVGGHPRRMPDTLGDRVRWEPGATPLEAVRALRRLGQADICHAHMTAAEAVAVATRRLHHGEIVSTRHFAARRGASPLGRIVAPWIAAGLTREVAISAFVAARLERAPDAVVVSGVPRSPCLWMAANRVVLVLQRLEPEKDTLTALRAWQTSQLVDDGWSLRVVGEGSQRGLLEQWVATEAVEGVTFTGWTDDVPAELRRAGIAIASAPAEPLGLAVLEAMAAGVPVAACASGGHLETVGQLVDARLFPPGNQSAAAGALRSMLPDKTRTCLSARGRELASELFTIEGHVEHLFVEYDLACGDSAVRSTDVVAAEQT